jgi:hypothetical protein
VSFYCPLPTLLLRWHFSRQCRELSAANSEVRPYFHRERRERPQVTEIPSCVCRVCHVCATTIVDDVMDNPLFPTPSTGDALGCPEDFAFNTEYQKALDTVSDEKILDVRACARQTCGLSMFVTLTSRFVAHRSTLGSKFSPVWLVTSRMQPCSTVKSSFRNGTCLKIGRLSIEVLSAVGLAVTRCGVACPSFRHVL